MADDKIIVEIDLVTDPKQVGKEFDKISEEAQKGGEEAGDSFAISFGRVAESFLGNLAADLFQNFAREVKSQLSRVTQSASQLEVFATQFKVITGSAQDAQKQISDLQNFAATTPFELPGLALATRQLLSFGVAQENIIPTLRQIGELAAGTGSSIDELTIPFGRLVSTQKLTLVELDKFADRGINLYQNLSDQTGIALRDIRDEISKGRVPFEEFTKALSDLTSEGGTFFNATIEQSKTLAGVTSTLEDSFFNLRSAVGNVFKPFLIQDVVDRINIINRLTEVINSNADAIRNGLLAFGQFVIDFFISPIQSVFESVRDFIFDSSNLVVGSLSDILESLGKFAQAVSTFTGLEDNPITRGIASIKDAVDNQLVPSADAGREKLRGLFDVNVEEFAQNYLDNVKKLSEQVSQVDIRPKGLDGGGPEAEDDGGFTSLTEKLNGLSDAYKEVGKTFNVTSKSIAKSVTQGIGNAASSAFASFGRAVATGEDALAAFGKSLLNAFGGALIQLGQGFILQGIAQSLSGFGSGAPLIAAGAALATFGGVLSGLASGGAGSSSVGNAGNENAGLVGGVSPDVGDEGFEELREPESRVTVNVNGDVFDSEETGVRIAQILSDTSLTNGIVISNGSFA